MMTCGMDVLWRRRAAALIPSATRILDIACGTGDFSRALQRRFPTATISGLDISPKMLEIARRKLPRLTFAEGDVIAAKWGSPDAIVCAFGFRNFPDKDATLAKAAATLPPGGHLLVLELWRRKSGILRHCVSAWLRLFALIFARSSREEYDYLRRSINTTLTADEFIARAVAAGLSLVRRIDFFPAATATLFRLEPQTKQGGTPHA